MSVRRPHTATADVETRLRRGLGEEGTLSGVVVVYQPIVHATTLRLTGFEALARWRDDAGELQPDSVIPIAEETGLIHPLGRQVLREACRQLAEWRRHFAVRLTVSVNLSGHQLLDTAFADEVAAALADHDLGPEALRLEITESQAAADPAAACTALEMLHRRIGVRAQLDDFGTGASSLTFLRAFPGDVLKIDRSFVAEIATDEGAYQVVAAFVGLAHNLGIEVVAEGVETEDQLMLLRGLGCEFVQGFFTGRPLEAGDAGRRLDAGVAAMA